MTNIRQVSNVTKEGNEYTLVNVKVRAEDPTAGKSAEAYKEVNQTYTSVSLLFEAIQQHTVDLVTSGLV